MLTFEKISLIINHKLVKATEDLNSGIYTHVYEIPVIGKKGDRFNIKVITQGLSYQETELNTIRDVIYYLENNDLIDLPKTLSRFNV